MISSLSNTATINLGFLGSGTFNTSISNTLGAINISVTNGSSGVINGTISTSQGGGSINVKFLDDKTKLILQGATNQITTLSSLASAQEIAVLSLSDNSTTTVRLKTLIDPNKGLGFELGNSSELILFENLENSGVVHLNFVNSMATLTGSVATNNSGETAFNLGSSTDLNNSTNTALAKIEGTLTNQGMHIFNLNAKNTTLQKRGVLILSSGSNIINFNNSSVNGSRLLWQDHNGATYILPISGGENTINFNNNGTIVGGINTSGGNTNINIEENKTATTSTGTIAGTIKTMGGFTHINLNGENANLTSNISSTTGTTSSGVMLVGTTTINFNKISGIITGDISTTSSGKTYLNFGSLDSDSVVATIVGNITNDNGSNTFNINAKNVVFKNGSSGLSFSAGENIINFTNDATLDWQNNSNQSQNIVTNDGNTKINFINNGKIKGAINTNNNGNTTLAINNGQTATILGNINANGGNTKINFDGKSGMLTSTISTSGGTTTLSLGNNQSTTINGSIATSGGTTTLSLGNNQSTTINGSIATSGGNTEFIFLGNSTLSANNDISTTDSGITTITLSDNAIVTINANITTKSHNDPSLIGTRDIIPTPMANSITNILFNSSKNKSNTLIVLGSSNQITTLTMGAGENILALTNGKLDKEAERGRRRITIDSIDNANKGKLKLVSQITENSADTFTIKNTSNMDLTQKNRFGITFGKGVKLDNVGSNKKILLASVQKNLMFETTTKTNQDFTLATFYLSAEQNGDYTDYYILRATGEVTHAEQAVTATAFMLNYDLYMANLNSLNKRMGELRENAHSQGVWARVFNGAQSNSFGLGSKNNYTTIQAGYDYAFGFEGANNYLGVALSYALSTSTTSSKATDSMGEIRSIDSIYSNAVEVALYNSYVGDSGWYNDTIAKFSYLMSSFDITNSNSNTTTSNDTTNFALTLGDEVGYVFKLGEAKEWSITPQVEFTMGYFNQSDFKQTLANSSAYLDSIAESVFTLRTRVGSAFAYDFKNFTQKDTFNASLYIGAFYEYDYVSGGNITMSTDQGAINNELSDIGSDGRVVMNVGTNMSIKDNTRLYFDFEKSFAGKITTDYQVNFGVRYSFGESNGYTPMIEKAEFKAPLKIEGKEKSREEQEGKDKVSETSQEKEIQ